MAKAIDHSSSVLLPFAPAHAAQRPAGLRHAVPLTPADARAALADEALAERERQLAMLDRRIAARVATLALLDSASVRGRIADHVRLGRALLGQHRVRTDDPGALVRGSGLFAAAWYRAQHRRALGGMLPIEHFLHHGLAANLAPNPFFDPVWYLAEHREARAAGGPALLHYILSGARQMLAPGPLFSAIAYVARYRPPARFPDPLAHYLAIGIHRGWAAIPVRVPIAA